MILMMSRALAVAIFLLAACGGTVADTRPRDEGMMAPSGCHDGIRWPSFPVSLWYSDQRWSNTTAETAMFWETSVDINLFDLPREYTPGGTKLPAPVSGVILLSNKVPEEMTTLDWFRELRPNYDAECHITLSVVSAPYAVREEDETLATCELIRHFGRALGLANDSDPTSVMSPCDQDVLGLDRQVTEQDRELLRQ